MSQINNQAPKVSRRPEPRRAKGLRLVQFWVPDTRSPSFIDDLRSQCLALRGDPAEAEVLKFSEQATQKIDRWV